jgi:spore coat polysaccharide biosynthesis protein SpsF
LKQERVGIVIAARTSSSRLPGKALLPLGGMPMVVFLLRRLRGMQAGRVVLATTDLPADDALEAAVAAEGVPVYRGAEDDVVARFVGAAARFGFDIVGRVTADCPFVDAELVDWCVNQSSGLGRYDLATTKGKFPVGLDVELFHADRMAALDGGTALSSEDREHLTLHFYANRHAFAVKSISPPSDWKCSGRTFTVDTADDYAKAIAIVGMLGRNDFSIPALLEAAR